MKAQSFFIRFLHYVEVQRLGCIGFYTFHFEVCKEQGSGFFKVQACRSSGFSLGNINGTFGYRTLVWEIRA